VVPRGVIVESDCAAEKFCSGLIMFGLMRDHAKQMQCVSVLRLHGNYLPANRLCLSKAA
jgi:hypothetical protein